MKTINKETLKQVNKEVGAIIDKFKAEISKLQEENERLKNALANIPEDQQERVSIAVAEAEEELEQKFKSDQDDIILRQAKEIDKLNSQISKLKEENESLKGLDKLSNNAIITQSREIDKLKEENEKLLKKLKTYSSRI